METAAWPLSSRRRAAADGLDVNAVCVKPEAERSDADRALAGTLSQLAARKEIVHRHSAGLEIAIEELTEPPSTVDGQGFPA